MIIATIDSYYVTLPSSNFAFLFIFRGVVTLCCSFDFLCRMYPVLVYVARAHASKPAPDYSQRVGAVQTLDVEDVCMYVRQRHESSKNGTWNTVVPCVYMCTSME